MWFGCEYLCYWNAGQFLAWLLWGQRDLVLLGRKPGVDATMFCHEYCMCDTSNCARMYLGTGSGAHP